MRLVCGAFSWSWIDVGDATPGQMGLGCTRTKAKQARKSKPVSNNPPWFPLQFLPLLPPWVSGLTSFNDRLSFSINPFLPWAGFVIVFITETEKETTAAYRSHLISSSLAYIWNIMIIFIILYDIVKELWLIEFFKETSGCCIVGSCLLFCFLFVSPHYVPKEMKILSWGFWESTRFNDILWEMKYIPNFACTFAQENHLHIWILRCPPWLTCM